MHVPEKLLGFFQSKRFAGHFETTLDSGIRLHGLRELKLTDRDEVIANQFELGWLAGACPDEFDLTLNEVSPGRFLVPETGAVGKLLGTDVVLSSSDVARLDLES